MFKREDFFKEFNLLIKSFTVELKTWFDDTTVITKELIVVSFCFCNVENILKINNLLYA